MNEARLRKLNTLVLLSIGVALVFILVFAMFFSPKNEEKFQTASLKDYSDGWILKMLGESEDMVDLPVKVSAKAGETVVITKRLPADVGPDKVLVFDTKFQNVICYVNEERVYQNGIFDTSKLTRSSVPQTHIVDLSGARGGDVISIYFVSAYGKYAKNIPAIKYGSKGDALINIVRGNAALFVLSTVLMILSIVYLISLVFIDEAKVDRRKPFYGFLFTLVMALYMLLDNPCMQFITKHRFTVYMASQILLLLVPVIYVMHQRCFAIKRRYAMLFEITLIIFAVNFLTGVIFQMTYVSDFATYAVFTKALIMLFLIAMSFVMYLAADQYMDRSILNNFASNIVITVAAVIETVAGFVPAYRSYRGTILAIGIYAFVIMMLAVTEKNLTRELSKSKNELQEKIRIKKKNAYGELNTKFIYSALGKGYENLQEDDPENASLIYNTTVYMKYNIHAATETGLVPFDTELQYIKSFLEVERIRRNNLEVEIEDKITEFQVPFNTVELLVENAVINGIGKKPGKIAVRSYERLDCFVVQIVDNGKGPSPDKKFIEAKTFKDIKKIIKSECGGIIEVKSKTGNGTIVSVMIPKRGFVMKED